jgi:MOSC domain-containing protein YiiM
LRFIPEVLVVEIISIQIGRPRDMGIEGAADPMDQPWTSAIHKAPVLGPVWLGEVGVAGDAQADTRFHGGPHQAVLCYSAGHYPRWAEELGIHAPGFGAFGENLTIQGLDEETACVGDSFAIGEARVQVSQPRTPCWKLARRWRRQDMVERVVATGRSGWYCSILREGMIEAGMEVVLLDRPHGVWTIRRAQETMRRRVEDPGSAAALAMVPALSPGWREMLLGTH